MCLYPGSSSKPHNTRRPPLASIQLVDLLDTLIHYTYRPRSPGADAEPQRACNELTLSVRDTMATCVLPLDLLNHIYNCHDASHSDTATGRGKDEGSSTDRAGDKGKEKAKSSKSDRKNGPTDVPDIKLHHYFNDPQADVVFLSAEEVGFAVPSHYVLKHR